MASPGPVQTPRRKAHPALKRPLASADDYEIRLGPGWTLNDGTYEHVSQAKRRKRNVPHPRYINKAYRSMYGLSSLQVAHNAPISMCAMDIATDHVWKCLPPEVKNFTMVIPPNGPTLWGEDDGLVEELYSRMDEDALEKFTRKPWVIWPLWVEDEWGKDYVLAVWFAESGPESPDVFDHILSCGIYDPRRTRELNPDGTHGHLRERSERLKHRLTEFFDRAGFDLSAFEGVVEQNSCPMPFEEATSGERCFAAVKEVLEYLLTEYIEDEPHDPRVEGFWDLMRWVNPYQYRIEMAGINAWVLMATLDFNARIVVEYVEPEIKTDVVADGQRRVVQPYHLAGPYEEPEIAQTDYLLDLQPDD